MTLKTIEEIRHLAIYELYASQGRKELAEGTLDDEKVNYEMGVSRVWQEIIEITDEGKEAAE